MALGHVVRASGHDNIVLAHGGVVDLLNDSTGLHVHDLAHRLLLSRVDLRHAGIAVNPNDPSNPLGVVILGDQVDDNAGNMPDGPSKVIHKVIGAGICLPFAGEDSLPGTLITGHA